MSTRKSLVHLFEAHALRLRDGVYRLMGRAGYPDPERSELTKKERTELEGLREEVDALVQLVRPFKPHDYAWTLYTKEVDSYARSLLRDSIYAPQALKYMLDMVRVAAGRLPFDERPWPPGVDTLARVVSDKTLPAHERSDARAVLGDLLEERGYANVADVLRLDRPRADLFVLPYLRGEFYVTPPKRRPR